MSFQGVGQAARHRRQRRLMQNIISALEQGLQDRQIGNAGLDNFQVAIKRFQKRQMVGIASQQIVDNAHPLSTANQIFGNMRADKASAAGHHIGLGHASPALKGFNQAATIAGQRQHCKRLKGQKPFSSMPSARAVVKILNAHQQVRLWQAAR